MRGRRAIVGFLVGASLMTASLSRAEDGAEMERMTPATPYALWVADGPGRPWQVLGVRDTEALCEDLRETIPEVPTGLVMPQYRCLPVGLRAADLHPDFDRYDGGVVVVPQPL